MLNPSVSEAASTPAAIVYTIPCDLCVQKDACPDYDNHRTRNILQNLLSIENVFRVATVHVQVSTSDKAFSIQREYALPLECPRTLSFYGITVRLNDVTMDPVTKRFYARGVADVTENALRTIVGLDGWCVADTFTEL